MVFVPTDHKHTDAIDTLPPLIGIQTGPRALVLAPCVYVCVCSVLHLSAYSPTCACMNLPRDCRTLAFPRPPPAPFQEPSCTLPSRGGGGVATRRQQRTAVRIWEQRGVAPRGRLTSGVQVSLAVKRHSGWCVGKSSFPVSNSFSFYSRFVGRNPSRTLCC